MLDDEAAPAGFEVLRKEPAEVLDCGSRNLVIVEVHVRGPLDEAGSLFLDPSARLRSDDFGVLLALTKAVR
jgi:hypothetical protein